MFSFDGALWAVTWFSPDLCWSCIVFQRICKTNPLTVSKVIWSMLKYEEFTDEFQEIIKIPEVDWEECVNLCMILQNYILMKNLFVFFLF